jgi:proline dehydrogenase
MSLFRGPVLAIANRPFVEQFVRGNRLMGNLVDRFVAGEDLETALDVMQPVIAQGIKVTLDELGENVSTEAEATAAVRSYVHILHRMSERAIEPNISIKLTMLGLDLGDDVTRANVRPILEKAREVNGFVRIDMEGSAYTERTMRLFESFHNEFPDEVGIVIQTMLKRADADIERMIERKARVRLVKGAYAEPAAIAFQDAAKIDENYRRLMERLLADGRYPAIATHDPKLIEAAIDFTRRRGIANDGWEFQMLYGVRRDEQTRLFNEGYRMRVYVPYGPSWYPYFTRRIAERPANALFVIRQFFSK